MWGPSNPKLNATTQSIVILLLIYRPLHIFSWFLLFNQRKKINFVKQLHPPTYISCQNRIWYLLFSRGEKVISPIFGIFPQFVSHQIELLSSDAIEVTRQYLISEICVRIVFFPKKYLNNSCISKSHASGWILKKT